MSCWAEKEFQKMISRRWIMPSSTTSVSTATPASMTCCRRTGTIFWISPTRILPRRNNDAPCRRTGVAPVSDIELPLSNERFFDVDEEPHIVSELLEDGDRRDACPTTLVYSN